MDISLLGDLAHEGWKVVFSEKFFKHMIDSGAMDSILSGNEEPQEDSVDWQGWSDLFGYWHSYASMCFRRCDCRCWFVRQRQNLCAESDHQHQLALWQES